MAHFGCGIWSQIFRMTGASLNGRRQAQMRTSAWRGESSSAPSRSAQGRTARGGRHELDGAAGGAEGHGPEELARPQLTKIDPVVTQLSEELGARTSTSMAPQWRCTQSHYSAPLFPMKMNLGSDQPHTRQHLPRPKNDKLAGRAPSGHQFDGTRRCDRRRGPHGIMNTVSMSKMMNSTATM